MPLRLNTNVPALNAQRILNITGRDLTKRIERLSSGLRVNRAADDAAGLSISEALRGEISGFTQGIRNSEHAVNLVQTAEGALSEVSNMLIRMRELAVQSASSTVNNSNRESINAEFNQLISEIDRIARVTSYNDSSILSGYGNTANQDPAVSTALASPTTGVVSALVSGAESGSYVFADAAGDGQITVGNGIATQTIDVGPSLDFDAAGPVVATGSAIVASFDRLGVQLTLSGQRAASGTNPATDGYRDGELDGLTLVIDAGTGGTFQVGPDNSAVDRLEVNIADMRANGTTIGLSGASLSTLASAQSTISVLDAAIDAVTQTRGDLGAVQNRLSFNIRASGVMLENDQDTESSIRDADIGEEISAFARDQILTQSGLAAFAQANITAASALTLLSS